MPERKQVLWEVGGGYYTFRPLPSTRLKTQYGRDTAGYSKALRELGLSGQPMCIHSSLRSFGHVEVERLQSLRAFLEEGCTIVVPTFSSVFAAAPPPHLQFERKGSNHSAESAPNCGSERVFTPEVLDFDRYMGVIPPQLALGPRISEVIIHSTSFTAVGPKSAQLVSGQTP